MPSTSSRPVPTWVSDTDDRRLAGVRRIEIELADGRVEIGARSGDDVRLRITVGTRGWRARAARRLRGFRPVVPPVQRDGEIVRFRSADARTRVQVDVPDQVLVVAGVADGEITMWGAGAELELTVAEGAIAARDLRARRIRATNAQGEVTLHFSERPATVTADSATGPVLLVVPAGPYAVDAPAAAEVTVHRDPAADATVTVRSGGTASILAAAGSAPI